MATKRVTLVALGSLVVGVGGLACQTLPDTGASGPASTEKTGVVSNAVVATGLFTTGVDANGVARTPTNGSLTDTHYELVASTDPSLAATLPFPARIVQADPQTAAQWTPNTATGDWISAFANTRAGGARYKYTYQTTFAIPAGVDPTKVVLSGAWACDDECTITLGLSGPVVATNTVALNGTPPSKPRPFAISEGSFTSTSVTLDFVVDNVGGFETGLLVTGFGGCTLDSQCRSTEFCDTQNGPCVNKLVNAAPVPTLTGHAPPLTGSCPSDSDAGAAVGAAVCVSGVCDPSNGECGLANGHGPCATGSVCQSGACGSDGLCGLKDGDGPCGIADSGVDGGLATVCRSGICNGIGTCGSLPDAGFDAAAEAQSDSTVEAQTDATIEGDAIAEAAPDVTPAPDTGAAVDAGCAVDSDCPAADYCDTPTSRCVPKLLNGQGVPTVDGHDPALTGTCGSGVGAAVCVSGVCDPIDDACGLSDGDGPCSPGDAGVTVCRSGMCNAAGVCGPQAPPGCASDSDCDSTAAQWCDTSQSTCVAKLTNGQPVPTVSGHAPTLAGTCDAAIGAIVCASGVCDTTDNECGLADGDGPCSRGDGGVTVCRTGMCNAAGVCGPPTPPGCTVDTDCNAASQWCDTSQSTCVAKLTNGERIPTVSGHAPALAGTCNSAVGAVVCASGVCDKTDSECGLANGDGPCSPGDAGVAACRSGMCNTAGVCGPQAAPGCTVDADCSPTQSCDTSRSTCVPKATGGVARCSVDADCNATNWCDTSRSTCVAKLTNGTGVPNVSGHAPALTGTCTAAVGAIVCETGVCDTADNACGYAKGDGPCTPARASACRSGACVSPAGVCGDNFVPSGSGVACSIVTPGESGRSAFGGIGFAVVAAFGMARRGRKRASKSPR